MGININASKYLIFNSDKEREKEELSKNVDDYTFHDGLATSRSKLSILNNKENNANSYASPLNNQNFSNNHNDREHNQNSIAEDYEDTTKFISKVLSKDASAIKGRNSPYSISLANNNNNTYSHPGKFAGSNNNNQTFELEDENQTKKFIMQPIETDSWLKCQIERKQCDKKVVKYIMTLNETGKFLISVIKKPKKSYHYFISKDAVNKKDKDYLGKLKSNFFGTEFNAYDAGVKPKKEKNKDLHRLNLASITYETNLFGLKGPRKMKVYIPHVNESDFQVSTVRLNGVINIKYLFLILFYFLT